jgi:hypothetical protein
VLVEKSGKHGVDEYAEIFDGKSNDLGEVIAEDRGNHGQSRECRANLRGADKSHSCKIHVRNKPIRRKR